MTQLIKFTNIHTDTNSYPDVDLEVEDSFELQCDTLDECNSAIMKHLFGSIRDATETIYYTVEYIDAYWNETARVNYSTNNKYWEV